MILEDLISLNQNGLHWKNKGVGLFAKIGRHIFGTLVKIRYNRMWVGRWVKKQGKKSAPKDALIL